MQKVKKLNTRPKEQLRYKIESILERLNTDNVVGEIKFFWNGFKINNGKLWKCYLSYNAFNGAFTYENNERKYFDKTVKDFFAVVNNTNSMIDYFETDFFVISKGSKYYNAVKVAYEKKYGKVRER